MRISLLVRIIRQGYPCFHGLCSRDIHDDTCNAVMTYMVHGYRYPCGCPCGRRIRRNKALLLEGGGLKKKTPAMGETVQGISRLVFRIALSIDNLINKCGMFDVTCPLVDPPYISLHQTSHLQFSIPNYRLCKTGTSIIRVMLLMTREAIVKRNRCFKGRELSSRRLVVFVL